MPPMNDLMRWNNRIVSNLLYYQTNYFVFLLTIVLIEGLFAAQSFVCGMSAVIFAGAVIYGSITSNPDVVNMRRDHPFVTLGLIVISVYYFIMMLPHVFLVTFCLLFPVLIMFIHASIRLRNINNKFSNAAEKSGLKTTVMGRILTLCGVNVRATD
ncbi:hypothetical protein WR25_24389 [Diploscapter pachys]|uniref:PRA1 family protein n=1 Tax=Diploscapter pachys TaxID=2018661 RepID=A0A2A2LTD7_9BILA|nr:hypothetical protein WR25_24389 [Diploscapter pachys]